MELVAILNVSICIRSQKHADLPFSENVATLTKLESVTLGVDVVPVVVDGVEDGVALDLGGTTGSVVDVVALHGDHVI